MAREVLLPIVLQTAIERRYLDTATAERVAVEASRRQLPIERALVVLGILSPRRVERLQLHVRYRSLRKVDKTYVKLAIRSRLVGEVDAEAALEEQRRRFEGDRECTRVGAILVSTGVITVAQDQEIRAKVARVSSEVVTASGSGSEATKLLAEESACSRSPAVMPSAPTYHTIDRAMGRIDAVKRAQQELSTTEQPEAIGAPRDSAAEFENAVRMLARRRVQSTTSSGGVIQSGGVAPDEGTSRTAGAPLDQPRRSGTRKLRSA